MRTRKKKTAARRARAVVAYDGTDYSGFQIQANAPSVQAALEEAIREVTGEKAGVIGAGRTDAGVHAVGQVIAFDTAWIEDQAPPGTDRKQRSAGDLQRALNAVLPADIAVSQLRIAVPDFHPRFDAVSRKYRYTVYNRPVRSPSARRHSLHVKGALDLKAMREAAALLVGEHDFAAFGRPPTGNSTVRRVQAAEWREEAPWLQFDIEANAFLYRMVRSVVGTLLQVGHGSMSAEAVGDVLASRSRDSAGPTAPPHGLSLIMVTY